ncbi:MAG: hypothetical protein KVP17_003223 [Porospora cf. gigantea B]|uniref:uncharacterized protein n=1 Tax=Porospora cf. gigantea B TaxID=2853592 RepID=UPI003571CD0A|nr:MAG: hypothetical protein KVP17_003223 [Porospora cf. gigantea B]
MQAISTEQSNKNHKKRAVCSTEKVPWLNNCVTKAAPPYCCCSRTCNGLVYTDDIFKDANIHINQGRLV